ncbi:hypothetical protein AB1A81_05020 [Bdellovibrio bacteriovorus]|uniref:Uncharacterized protein n=1 Tax=Bdellovibrio bacteriovorus (strain ATCC 15356 / DSM 50701 / NCIMB 9529 / HD100) TaxID=264462 RepID=Q6MNY3_BDEBA|nr:hypothetical protein [Bdellovibrio bacteriovorus]CAE79016.1 hypothetical protein predicted by Glimmer/Critica [Bdellovibrio bacteriovorus HD100]
MGSSALKFLIPFLTCLVSIQVQAQSVESDFMANQCPEISSFSSVNLWQDGNDLSVSSCGFAQKLADVVDSISDWAPVSEKIMLSLKHSASGASYDGVKVLSAAEFLYIESSNHKEKHLRTEQGNLTTFAHEYGHVILTDWLTCDIPEFKAIREGIASSMIANQKVYFLANQRGLIEKRIIAAPTQSHQERLLKKKQDIERQLAQAYFEAGEFSAEQNRILNLLAPYHELFADVVAVLYAEDPQAMRKAVEFPSGSNKDIYMAEARDFTVGHAHQHWNDSTPHYMLSPVRSSLFAGHWIKRYSSAEKREYLVKVYNLLRDDILSRWHQETPSVQDANKTLIEKINSRL